MMIIPILAIVVIVAAVGMIVPSLNKVVFAEKGEIPNVKAGDNPFK
jgi:hypothetical protein